MYVHSRKYKYLVVLYKSPNCVEQPRDCAENTRIKGDFSMEMKGSRRFRERAMRDAGKDPLSGQGERANGRTNERAVIDVYRRVTSR